EPRHDRELRMGAILAVLLGLLVLIGLFSVARANTDASAQAAPLDTATPTLIPTSTATPTCGPGWYLVDTPDPDPSAITRQLYGVAAFGADDIWAVGSIEYDITTFTYKSLTMHWDGASWSVVPAVDTGSSGDQFFAVAG